MGAQGTYGAPGAENNTTTAADGTPGGGLVGEPWGTTTFTGNVGDSIFTGSGAATWPDIPAGYSVVSNTLVFNMQNNTGSTTGYVPNAGTTPSVTPLAYYKTGSGSVSNPSPVSTTFPNVRCSGQVSGAYLNLTTMDRTAGRPCWFFVAAPTTAGSIPTQASTGATSLIGFRDTLGNIAVYDLGATPSTTSLSAEQILQAAFPKYASGDNTYTVALTANPLTWKWSFAYQDGSEPSGLPGGGQPIAIDGHAQFGLVGSTIPTGLAVNDQTSNLFDSNTGLDTGNPQASVVGYRIEGDTKVYPTWSALAAVYPYLQPSASDPTKLAKAVTVLVGTDQTTIASKPSQRVTVGSTWSPAFDLVGSQDPTTGTDGNPTQNCLTVYFNYYPDQSSPCLAQSADGSAVSSPYELFNSALFNHDLSQTPATDVVVTVVGEGDGYSYSGYADPNAATGYSQSNYGQAVTDPAPKLPIGAYYVSYYALSARGVVDYQTWVQAVTDPKSSLHTAGGSYDTWVAGLPSGITPGTGVADYYNYLNATDNNFTVGADFVSTTTTLTVSYPIVHFDSNGGTGTMPDEQLDSSSNIILSKNTFTRSGYLFTGWNTVADGTGTSYHDGASLSHLSNDLTLFAQWTAISNKVIFESNGGSAVPEQSVLAGNKAVEPPAPTRDGYDFAGWFSDKELNTLYDFNTPINSDETLFAKWTKCPETAPPNVPNQSKQTNQSNQDNNSNGIFTPNTGIGKLFAKNPVAFLLAVGTSGALVLFSCSLVVRKFRRK